MNTNLKLDTSAYLLRNSSVSANSTFCLRINPSIGILNPLKDSMWLLLEIICTCWKIKSPDWWFNSYPHFQLLVLSFVGMSCLGTPTEQLSYPAVWVLIGFHRNIVGHLMGINLEFNTCFCLFYSDHPLSLSYTLILAFWFKNDHCVDIRKK